MFFTLLFKLQTKLVTVIFPPSCEIDVWQHITTHAKLYNYQIYRNKIRSDLILSDFSLQRQKNVHSSKLAADYVKLINYFIFLITHSLSARFPNYV